MAIWGMGVMLGPDPGADARRLPHRYLQLALRLLRQPALRHRRDLRHHRLHARGRGQEGSRGSIGLGFGILAIALAGLAACARSRRDQRTGSARTRSSPKTVLAVLGFYLFTVHMLTSNKPLLPKGIFTDRNMLSAMLMMFPGRAGFCCPVRRCWRLICRSYLAIRCDRRGWRWRRAVSGPWRR